MSVKHGVLAILARRPLHGYELKQELETELGSSWSVNYGQIYTTLERLTRDALVVQSDVVAGSDAPDRKLYSITPAGQDELNRWFLSPVVRTENSRDELYAKIILSFVSTIPTEDVLQIQRKEELQRMHDLTKLKQYADQAVELPWILQLDLVILQSEATLRWLNMCEARLRKLRERTASDISVKVKPPAMDTHLFKKNSIVDGLEIAEVAESTEAEADKPEISPDK